MTEFRILGRSRGPTEELDTADDASSADYLVGEYRLAFGAGWSIWKEEVVVDDNNQDDGQ